MTSAADHVDVAAYVLGALDEPDVAAFERHLAACPRCQAELDELSGLPSLLDQVRDSGLLADLLSDDAPGLGDLGPGDLPDLADFQPASSLPPPRAEDAVLRGVMVDIADARRRRRRAGWLAAAAAAVLIVGGPLITLGVTGALGGGPAETIQARNGPVTARIGLNGQDYGTDVSFDLTGVQGPLNCTLNAVTKDGRTYPVSSWLVPPTGYGVDGSPDALHITGSVAIKRADLAKLEFAREGGPDILDITL
jgi:hypothetical protein